MREGRLYVLGKDGREAHYDLVVDHVSLGRAEDNFVVLSDTAVSRRHAEIYRKDADSFVMDFGSLNGTVVNGIRIAARQPFLLRNNDRIFIGPFTLTFNVIDASSIDSAAVGLASSESLPKPPPSAGGIPTSPSQPVLIEDGGSQPGSAPTVVVSPEVSPFVSRPGTTAPSSRFIEEQVPITGDLPALLPEPDIETSGPRVTSRPTPPPQVGATSGPRTIVTPFVQPKLLLWSGGKVQEHMLQATTTSIGRGSDNSIVIDDPTVSRHHCEIRRSGSGFEIVDLGSGNGIYQAGQRINQKILVDNDSFQIGEGVQIVYRASSAQSPGRQGSGVQAIDIGSQNSLTIGRDISNDVALSHPQVSRFHARLDRQEGRFVLSDLDSTNGTFVNGERITQQLLRETDHFQVGPYDFVLSDGRVQTTSAEGHIRVDAIGLSKLVGRGVSILSDVYLTIKPKEFVAVVGASGSGKSTLVDALSGFRPATSGKVLYNGNNLYRTFDAFRTSIGYVPQDDIIHRDLTVYRALRYAAQLRLPRDTTATEREARIGEVLDDLGLTERRDTRISQLSGGQRKRVSIGVELLTKPSLFFLDEPTSGLDPATETRMMRLLRELADQGRTLVLITHATQNILLCDKVVFMSRGGRIAFFGRPHEALDFFQVQEFVDIYELLDKEPSAGHYADRYRSSPFHQIHLGDLVGASGAPPAIPEQVAHVPSAGRSTISRFMQYLILTQRYLDITISNRKALAILLLQAPIVALLIGAVFPRTALKEGALWVSQEKTQAALAATAPRPPPGSPNLIPTFQTTPKPFEACGVSDERLKDYPEVLRTDPELSLKQPCGDARKGMLMLFLVAVVSIWFGTSNAAKEIVKELPIYRRERMVSLKIMPYLLSKMSILFGLCFVQTVFLLAIVMGMIAFPVYSVLTPVAIFATTFFTFVAASMMGLFISSVVGTQDEAGNVTPILLIPQIIFAGAMLSLGEMGAVARYIAQITISKWSWEALGGIVRLRAIIDSQGGPMESLLAENKWRDTFNLDFLWGQYTVLAAFCLVFLAGSYLALKRKDSL